MSRSVDMMHMETASGLMHRTSMTRCQVQGLFRVVMLRMSSLAPFLPLATWRDSYSINDGFEVSVSLHLFAMPFSLFGLGLGLGLRERRHRRRVQRTTHELPPDHTVE